MHGSRTDYDALCGLNEEFLATRESAELRGATVQMGFSMRSLLSVLPDMPAALNSALQTMQEPSLPCVWSGAATAWAISPLPFRWPLISGRGPRIKCWLR